MICVCVMGKDWSYSLLVPTAAVMISYVNQKGLEKYKPSGVGSLSRTDEGILKWRRVILDRTI